MATPHATQQTETAPATFALVVVRRDDQFLLVHERAHGTLWTLPAGRVATGESLLDAARRETLDETGVEVEIDGLLRVEHTCANGTPRLRVIFTARPLGERAPALSGARWISLEELDGLELRAEALRDIFEVVARRGRAPYPLELLAPAAGAAP